MKYLYSAKKLLLLFLLTSICSLGYGQTIGTYNFNSGTCSTQTGTASVSNVTLNATTTGAGLTCTIGSGAITLTSTSNWPASLTYPANSNAYLEFSVTPAVGYEVNISQVIVKAARGNGGAKNLTVAYDNGSGYSTATSASIAPATVTTSSLAFTLDIPDVSSTSTVTFRLYGYTGAVTSPKSLITDYIQIDGNVAIASPTMQSSIAVTSATINSATLSFTGGNGSQRLVLAQEASPISAAPTDLTSYNASSVFGASSTPIGGAAFPVYIGSGNAVTVTGLNPSTTYYFSVFEFNKLAGTNTENYLLPGGSTSVKTNKGIYTWSAGSSGSWANPASWTPNRNSPAFDGSDSLIFNSGGTITVTNVTDQDVFSGLSIFNNTHLILSASAPTTLYAIDFSGYEIAIESGSTLEINSTNDFFLYLDYNSSLTSEGTLILAKTNNTIIGTGDITINGTISLVHPDGLYGTSGSNAIDAGATSLTLGAASTVNYAGAAQTITTANPTPYANLTLSGSGTKTPDGNLDVHNLTLSGTSVLALAAYELSVAGNWTSYSAAAFTETGKTVTFNGTAAQTLSTTGGEIFEGLNLNNSSLTLSSPLRVNGLVTLTAGTLTAGGNLTLNLATAKIDAAGSGSISGNMKVIRNFVPAKTHYIASPLAGVTAADIADEYPVVSGSQSRLLDLDCSTNKFFGIYDMSTPLAQGDALSMFFPASGTPANGVNTVTFTGTYNHAAASYSSSCPVNTSVKDFFAGNPYPSNLFLGGITGSGTSGNYYVFNNNTFNVYSSVTGIGTGVIVNGYVAPMQGFQVETDGTGGTASVTIPSSARDVAQTTSYARTAVADNIIRLQASNGTFTDETVILFTDAATNGFDLGYDAGKMRNTGTNTPNLYTLADTTKLIINSLAPLTNTVDIPLNITTTTTSNYTLSFTNKDAFDTFKSVYLIFPDGALHNLTQNPAVTVATNPATPYILRVGTENITTSASKAKTNNALKAYMNEDMLVVTMNSNIQQVEVYDLTGNRIAEGTTDAGSFTTKLSAKAGIYVVKVLSENNLYTTKIAVK
ncbi:T9SS type A sorting domain-containing protein [Cytophaga hutchinsonii]|uniref:CHU large protein n=1 Tax=Cytophaga hutchinsonii (strain ATCC 33406 / DSM 1761 / CIP 103989 / NBRC 15051 / NCIMB 9469 / D465) TaxID=269798 RepID=A0A6N4SPA2_CYTH3|nr:T9SS type A sorting domain-containing protein [Cytophaga hutchinsonii]ABG58156.1 CHU large protein [Cytophaga hutchinsonii ATCC 33406]